MPKTTITIPLVDKVDRRAVERFWDNVFVVPYDRGCWIWTGATMPKGYGVMNIQKAGGVRLVHRLSYEINRGIVPVGMCVLHRCDNARCVNPDHLFIGDRTKNNADMRTKGRHSFGRKHSEACAAQTRRKFLVPADVLEIRKKFTNGVTSSELAKQYNATVDHIRKIVLLKRWRKIV